MARGVLLALLWVATAHAAAARLKADATLYTRPSATSEVVAQLPAGTRVEVLSQSSGWHEVKSPSGQGFVRSDHLVLGELAEPAPKPAEPKAAEPKAQPKPAEPKPAEAKALEAEPAEAKTTEPKPAAAAPAEKKVEKPATAAPKAEPVRAAAPAPVPDTDRISAEEFRQLTEEVRLLRARPEPASAADLDRVEKTLTQAIVALKEKPASPDDPPLPDTSLESVLAVSPVLLIVGAIIGWVTSRLTQRRRDNRNRIRV